jgi:hypothetical protein
MLINQEKVGVPSATEDDWGSYTGFTFDHVSASARLGCACLIDVDVSLRALCVLCVCSVCQPENYRDVYAGGACDDVIVSLCKGALATALIDM